MDVQKEIYCAGGMYQLYNANIPVSELLEEIEKCRILYQTVTWNAHTTKTRRVRIVTREQISVEFLESVLEKF